MERRAVVAAFAVLVLGCILLPSSAAPRIAAGDSVVISQVYGSGNNSGATWQNDYVELFNTGTTAIDVGSWSLQYASATGSAWGSNKVILSGLIQPGGYYLVRLYGGTTDGSPLPAADATGALNLSGTSGKVALVSSTGALSAVACPSDASLVDQLDYGPAASPCRGNPTPNLSATTAAFRNGAGCVDTQNNALDFTTASANPRNSASPANLCNQTTAPSGVGAANPAMVAPGANLLLTVAVTPGRNPVSSGLTVNCDASAINGAASQALYDDGSHGDATAGDNTFSWATTLLATQSEGAKSLPCSLGDAQGRTGAASILLTVATPGAMRIHDIQGATHISPLNLQVVSGVPGIVTAIRSNGFYLQDPQDDADPATSEGIFVFTGSTAAGVQVGDYVLVGGKVTEYRQSGNNGNNLTLTEIGGSPTVAVISHGNALPAPIVIGAAGRVPPAKDIENDANGNAESTNLFDPNADGLDFYESLEGMRVAVNDALVVGPAQVFTGAQANREIPVVPDGGVNATGITLRGGIAVTGGDFNPERIILNDMLASAGGPTLPADANTGDTFPGTIIGVLDYSYGNFKLEVSSLPDAVANGLKKDVAAAPEPGQLAVSTFNVENLAATDPQAKFDGLAALFVNNLKAPDIVSVEEVQDNNGVTDDGIVNASLTWARLIAAIQAAGGPTYFYRQIDPLNDQDGGAPGGNIRQGFLFRSDRGVTFIDRGSALATSANSVACNNGMPSLAYSPGRLDPANSAFNNSRKPLAGEIYYNGHHLFLVAVHLNSKGGDDPLFGRMQPPLLTSEAQRTQQAAIVHDFVNQILACNAGAEVVVLGDLNDLPFSAPLATLRGTPAILYNLGSILPPNAQYSYVYEGNSEMLDYILTSSTLALPAYFAPLHVNAEFAMRASDHDPVEALFAFAPGPPQLAGFSAAARLGGVGLAWQTLNETGLAGFNILRSDGPDGPFNALNASLIASQAGGAGRDYAWFDEGALPGQRYYYKLQLIGTQGESTESAVVAASGGPAIAASLALPHVGR